MVLSAPERRVGKDGKWYVLQREIVMDDDEKAAAMIGKKQKEISGRFPADDEKSWTDRSPAERNQRRRPCIPARRNRW